MKKQNKHEQKHNTHLTPSQQTTHNQTHHAKTTGLATRTATRAGFSAAGSF